MLWLEFFICFFIILFSGSKLSLYAEMICEKGRFSAGLMGIFFLAIITSLPELVTSLRSIAEAVDAPDIASGDLIGADIINVFVIALLGVLCRKGSILTGQNRANILTAVLTVLMLLIIIGSISLSHFGNINLELFHLSLGSILIGGVYLLGSFYIYKLEPLIPKTNTTQRISSSLVAKTIISGVAIVAAGIWLAHVGKGIADFYHLNEMSVGLILIAFTTTMPEFAVSFTALKRNSVHMAAGNLIGSNFFNLFIMAILDISYRKGDFFLYVSTLNILPAFVATALTAIAVIAMLKKHRKGVTPRFYSWDTIAIIAIFIAYLVGAGISFSFR